MPYPAAEKTTGISVSGPPPPGKVVLTIIAGKGGTTEPPPGSYEYDKGSTVTVTAIPSPGYVFNYWTLDSETRTENPITFTINADATLTAYFKLAPPPPGKARLTISVKLLGLIPMGGVKIRINGFELTTDKDGTAIIDLDVDKSYTGRAESPLIDPVDFKVDPLRKDTTIEIKPIPSLLLWTLSSTSVSGITYFLTKNAKKTLLAGLGLESLWIPLKLLFKPLHIS